MAPQATIVAVKVLNNQGSGSFGTIISGIEYATGMGVDVINMSLGATFDRVNAGGGGLGLNSQLWSIPAQIGAGMAVSATGPVGLASFDRRASYSNYGQSVIDVPAPGGDDTLYPANGWQYDMVISCGNRSTTIANTYYFADGTSMATPHVFGLAALLVGKYGKMAATQIKARIEQSADAILKPGPPPRAATAAATRRRQCSSPALRRRGPASHDQFKSGAYGRYPPSAPGIAVPLNSPRTTVRAIEALPPMLVLNTAGCGLILRPIAA